MMKLKRVEYKVPGGKLVAAEAEMEGGRISRVKITGDFFMHPEAEIARLESALIGVTLEELNAEVDRFFADRSIQLLGIAHADFTHIIRLSLSA